LVSILVIKKAMKSESDTENKALATAKPKKKPLSISEPYRFSDVWLEFDKTFDRFRREMENVMWPREKALARLWPSTAMLETRMPSVDIEDRGNDFLVTIEAAGCSKDEIDITVCGSTVEVNGCKETVQDERIRKERTHV